MLKPVLTVAILAAASVLVWGEEKEPADRPGVVHCANLIYGRNQTSRCFADHFLADAQKESNVWTAPKFHQVNLESQDLFNYPFAVMSGESAFAFTTEQIENLRQYVMAGGFLVASPGCSSPEFAQSFLREIAKVFPDVEMQELPNDHPIFHTVYDIDELKTKKKDVKAILKAIVIEGRVAVIFSREGLNDTGNAGGSCCCCGGNEILNARQVNVNILTYALTH